MGSNQTTPEKVEDPFKDPIRECEKCEGPIADDYEGPSDSSFCQKCDEWVEAKIVELEGQFVEDYHQVLDEAEKDWKKKGKGRLKDLDPERLDGVDKAKVLAKGKEKEVSVFSTVGICAIVIPDANADV